jgi:hypothetical protein
MNARNSSFFHMNVATVRTGKTADKHKYNSREGKYAQRGDLVAKGEKNMPEGVSAQSFYKELDANDRRNGGATEIKIALPRALPVAARIELAKELVERLAGLCPVTWAVHEPKAALEGGDQPHLHALLCRRISDGLPRPLGQVFRRFNRNEPQRGGWPKDSGGPTRTAVKQRLVSDRSAVSAIMNSALEKHGIEQRVTHESHETRQLNEQPGKHLGPTKVRALVKSREGEK